MPERLDLTGRGGERFGLAAGDVSFDFARNRGGNRRKRVEIVGAQSVGS